MSAPVSFVVLDRLDSVGVCIRGVQSGDELATPEGLSLIATRFIPRGHKIALRKHSPGEAVVKYGATIGLATVTIERGDHVHTHNMITVRGRDAQRYTRSDNQPESGARSTTGPLDPQVAITDGANRPCGSQHGLGSAKCDGKRPLPVRRNTVVMSSVSCANVVCDRVAHDRPDLVVITHQNGCGQIGIDARMTREVLAALGSHPNVLSCVVVGLGCETNSVDDLAASIRRRGGECETIGIQRAGGLKEAVERLEAVLTRLETRAERGLVSRAAVPNISVGVVADDIARRRSSAALAAVLSALSAAGMGVIHAAPPESSRRVPFPEVIGGSGVPSHWSTPMGFRDAPLLSALAMTPKPKSVSVTAGCLLDEQLTAVVALGAHVVVYLNGTGSPLGSRIAPTLNASVDARLDALEDVIDIPWSGVDWAGRILQAVRRTAEGAPTKCDRFASREIGIPRLGPSY